MILSYVDVLGDGQRHRIEAEITTAHSQSSYGQPVIVLPDGGLLDATSWVLMAYQVEKATTSEFELLKKWINQLVFLLSEGEQNLISVDDAIQLAESEKQKITDRAIRLACENGYIQNARKIGGRWLFSEKDFLAYLQNRPKPGRKKKSGDDAG